MTVTMEQLSRKVEKCRILVVLSLCGLAVGRHCDYRHYWDTSARVCRPCAKCPLNEIIRKPCGKHSNTVCGPFREFNFFNQLDDLESSYTSYEYDSFLGENSSGVDDARDIPGKTGSLQNEPIVQKDDGEYWKNLAFALIGVVCVLIFVATIVVLMACRKLHENAAIKRPDEEDDDDSGYVVIRAIRPPNMVHRAAALSPADPVASAAARALLAPDDAKPVPLDTNHLSQRQELRPKGTYTPTRRLLNYDADDVFESEDSSGSRSSRRVPSQPVVEPSSAESVVVCADDEVSISSELPV